MWRWSLDHRTIDLVDTVISTYVEMILSYSITFCSSVGDLHVCGDDPDYRRYHLAHDEVISTYVEMILNSLIQKFGQNGDLHVCGDDPVSILCLLTL